MGMWWNKHDEERLEKEEPYHYIHNMKRNVKLTEKILRHNSSITESLEGKITKMTQTSAYRIK